MSWLEAQCYNQCFQITTSCCDGLSNSSCNICIWRHAIRPSLFAIQMLLHRCHERHSSQQQLLFVGRCFMLHWKKHFIFDRCCISFLYCCHLCGAHLRHCYTLAEQSVRAVIWCLFWVAWWNIALSTAKDKHWGFRCTSPLLFEASGWFKFQILHT